MLCSLMSEISSLPQQCTQNCSKEFGMKIGSFEGVDAFSNCNNDCIANIGNYINKDNIMVFSGMKWQCVEYARRFLIQKFGVYFDDVESAFQIYDKAHVLDFKKRKYSFVSYENWNVNAPQKYDVLIYKKTSDAPYGHVAIISKVSLKRGYVEICEQNYSLWKKPSQYSRKLQLLFENGKHIITEEPYIPFPYDKSNLFQTTSRPNNTIGWKRLQLNN